MGPTSRTGLSAFTCYVLSYTLLLTVYERGCVQLISYVFNRSKWGFIFSVSPPLYSSHNIKKEKHFYSLQIRKMSNVEFKFTADYKTWPFIWIKSSANQRTPSTCFILYPTRRRMANYVTTQSMSMIISLNFLQSRFSS